MKDAKGHGSDPRGGAQPVAQPAAAHQMGVEQATAPMQRRQYEAIAGAINSYPGDKTALAQHFAGGLQGSNPKFDSAKFTHAATTGNMGRTKGADPGMQRRHYEAVASMLKNFEGSHPGSGVAEHFTNEFGRRNRNFDSARFRKAAS